MTNINLFVSGTSARAEVTGDLTSGMVGIPVTISYDSAWDGLKKTLVCRAGGITRAVADVENSATVAHEVMVANARLQLGVEGRNDDGTLVIPTVWAQCAVIQPGANADADPSLNPGNPMWVRLQNAIGNLDDLETTAKENLVAAINEALSNGGGTQFETDETLSLKDGVLSVNTTNVVEENNPLPVTSAAVHSIVGDIETLLALI